MSKGYAALIAVLALLAGAGCTAAVMGYVNQKDREAQFDTLMEMMQNASETPTEKTAETTEPPTETAIAETTAEPAVTEIVTVESGETQGDGFYNLIQNSLIPAFGLSDLAGFDRYGQLDNTYLEQPIPKSTQGIIGAEIHDFNNDGTEECVVIRADKSAYHIDLYDAEKTLLDTYTVWDYEPNACSTMNTFRISIIDSRIVIEEEWGRLPGYSTYGTDAVILSVSEDEFTVQLRYGGMRNPGSCSLYVNDDSDHIGEFDETPEFSANMQAELETELDEIGMGQDEILSGWDVAGDLCYGFNVSFTAERTPLFDFGYSGDLNHFEDHTGLRDKIS